VQVSNPAALTNFQQTKNEMNVFKIARIKGYYSVSIPDYPGGDVVPYETARDLQNELEAERAKVERLWRLLNSATRELSAYGPGEVDIEYETALTETKPNEQKLI